MYIKKVNIENFGPISKLECQLKKDKINFIIGDARTGKTSFMAAIYNSLKKEKYIYYDKMSKRIANIMILVALEEQEIEIHQKYRANGQELEIKKITNLSQQIRELEESEIIIIKDLSKTRIQNIDTDKIINFLRKYEEKVSNPYLYKSIIERLQNHHRNILLSGGEQTILKMLDILCKIKRNAIVMCDAILEGHGAEVAKFIFEIMYKMEDVQFIIMKSIDTKCVIPMQWSNLIRLGPVVKERNPVGVYETKWQEHKIVLKKPKKEIKENHYYQGEIVKEEENKNIEYKEIKGNNPCNAITQNAVVYTVAFLNTEKIKKGYIKWGITDDRKVKGIVLNSKQKDTIRKRICEELKKIKPYIADDDYQIQFQKVYNQKEEEIKDTYIVELEIDVKKSEYLYATPKEEVYIKTDGGKRKLTTVEIQEETRRRILNNRNF